MTDDATLVAPADGILTDETGTQRLLGYVLDVGQGDGRARCRMQVGPQHLNRQGILHGGLAATLLDNALGATASLSVDQTGMVRFSTVTLNIDFLSPGLPGPVEAVGQLKGGGRKIVFVEGALHHADGTLIATASGVFRRASGVAHPAATGGNHG